MTRPSSRLVLSVGRWELHHSSQGWIIKDSTGDNTCWPSSLQAALSTLYEYVICDNRFSIETQNDMRALRNAIVAANEMFDELLTSEKITELNEILRGERP